MARLTGGRQLAKINRENPELGSLISRLIDAHNHMAAQSGIDPVGQASAPPQPSAVNVTVTGEIAHIRVTDNNPTTRPRHYFSEVHTDPQFTSPKMVVQHGATRDAQVVLPTLNGDSATQNYYIRTYSQTPGSPPSLMTTYPAAVTMAGTTQGDLPSSAGSGTSAANGMQSGQGFGTFQTRKGTGPKRQ